MQFRFSIRVQLAVLSLFLFTIPWLGYKYVWEVEQYLRIGQEQTMIGTARAVATALHERPALFDSQAAFLQNVRPGTDLYAPTIDAPIQLDGKLNDWQSVRELSQTYTDSQIVTQFASKGTAVTLSYDHMVGRHGDYLYAMFEVNDNSVVWRSPDSLSVDNGDHLLISLKPRAGDLERYIIAPYASGWVNAFRLNDNPNSYRATGNALAIQGRWQETPKGYNIELRFPLTMTSGSLAFALVDVDDTTQRIKQYAMGTADPARLEGMGTVVTPSPEIERILSGIRYADSRVWVVDKHKRVLARAGDIRSAPGYRPPPSPASELPLWQWIESHWLLPLYYHILTRPPADFVDELQDAYALAGLDITTALGGHPDSLWRLSPDNKAVILSAAYPIFIDGQVMGAVVVEQTTHGIRSLRNRALEKLFHVILAVMLLGTAALFLFAHRISSRIRTLRDNTEAVIDDHGKIVGQLPQSRQRDEIGDLSRAFGGVLNRLQQYNSYLEAMAARLSHELRTPVAIVRSSLDALPHVPNDQQPELIERAQQGINRLSRILNSMSEATRLEQTLALEDPEVFELRRVVEGCAGGYQQAYPNRTFALAIAQGEYQLTGSAELLAQLLDKIVTNAAEFSNINDTISIDLRRQGRQIRLSISNPGPLLPEGMGDQLLQSMVSIRKSSVSPQQSQAPHLGLGLYIANLITRFHNGNLQLENLPDGSGVRALLSFPAAG
ncbi:proteobacterial dedicated sortase system histidine kinase [Alteromonas aestuariivivens]|uniref:histidine kinase n=1 Tax=Alteromonas aestuariivivens TaxID=1938339 RepID=A0A3D8M3L2_9ALTE|nr:proteobacterial dedicated sortase system histidine kinase [Alteromonas aestuariivivens]RDV24216.1 proteobacterial dedicated sortase system histidine kinase [Alteromonas aestuariivivens]